MMISPERFVKEHADKSYESLVVLRNKLLKEISVVEDKHTQYSITNTKTSANEKYKQNLKYLIMISELILEKYQETGEDINNTILTDKKIFR